MTDFSENSPNNPEELGRSLQQEVSRLNRLSLRGVMALALYIGISSLAWQGLTFFPSPDAAIALLGTPPTPRMISVALLIYTFFAIVLSLARMASGIEHRSSFGHVAFLTGFYLFYYFGKSLDDNFWAVFGAGITVLGVESYRIWNFCSEATGRIREDLAFIARTGRIPPKENG